VDAAPPVVSVGGGGVAAVEHANIARQRVPVEIRLTVFIN
jgi:hypothetical protein